LTIDTTKRDIDEHQREHIEKSIRDVMAEITNKPNLNVDNLSDKQIKGMDLSPGEIDELLKLKHLYVELESDKP